MRPFQPQDIYRINWLSEAEISPDGARAAYVLTTMREEQDDYRSSIWMLDVATGATRQFTAGARRDGSPRWSPDGTQLAFLSERGDDKRQIYAISTAGGEARKLTDLKTGAGVPAWSPDGSRIAFSARTGAVPDPDSKKARPYRRISTLRYKLNGEGFVYDRRAHIFVTDVTDGTTRQLTDGDAWDDTQPAWSPDGRSIAFVSARHDERDYDNHSDIWIVAAAGGEPRKVTGTEGAVGAPSFSPDGNTIAHIHTPMWPANPRLRLCDTAGGNFRYVDDAFDRATGAGSLPGAVAQPAWTPDGALISLAQERGTSALIRAREGAATVWIGAGRSIVSWYSTSADRKRAVVVRSTAGEPGEVAVLDLETGAPLACARHSDELLSTAELAAAEHFVVEHEDTALDCWIMKPAGFAAGRRYPVVLNIHGGPFGQFGETFFDEFQVYTGAGYGVVFCNPRGGSGQDTAFAREVVADMGGPDFRDVMACFETALERMPWADRERLGVMGGSYGGFMTAWIVGHDHRFAAGIVERGVTDWYTMQGASDIGSYFNRNYLGEEAVISQDLQAVLRQSPLTYARDIQTPVLILHSEDDLRCPIDQAEQLWVALKLMRQDVEFVRFPDENHELSRSGKPSHRVDRFEVILDYLERKLGTPGG
jgi:dipeptidyl aminopeptidase/acylaminoacyl peptidase